MKIFLSKSISIVEHEDEKKTDTLSIPLDKGINYEIDNLFYMARCCIILYNSKY